VLALTAADAALTEVGDPTPGDDEVLVRVHASSLNRGEAVDLPTRPAGALLGWDVAGVVERPSAGFVVGTRVVGLVRRGAWAQLVAVPVSRLAAIPDGVSFSQAATLPTAGLTALRALERGGFLLGKRVLVTGATGGVGGMAVQLARAAGALVSTSLPSDDQFDLIVDAVGGEVFGQAIEHVAPRGIVVNIGTPSPDATVTFRSALLDRAPGATIVTLNLPDEPIGADDLGRLCALLADGRLDARIAEEVSWRDLPAAMDRLLRRRVKGKIVLLVD
jgi:NADPH:quinone reductase-like Zn-dependent oxidoreductase